MSFSTTPHRRVAFSPLVIFFFAVSFSSYGFSGIDLASLPAQVSYSTSIVGRIIDKSKTLPISGARIEVPDLNLSTWSDGQGQFFLTRIPIPEALFRTRVKIQAEGFGDWTVVDVRLFNKDTLILDAQLEADPVTILIPEINRDERYGPEFLSLLSSLGGFGSTESMPSLPDTIRIRVTGQVAHCNQDLPYTVEVVDFKQYVKNVLPNEWYASWPRESLRAGALAAKMYTWQIVANGGRYDDADVYDSVCDQVYIAGVEYASTNNAVEFTWNWRLTHPDGSLFRTHYLDWYWRCRDYGWQGFCIGQWDTLYHALGNNGYDKLSWDEMIFRYYWNSSLSYIPTIPPSKFMLHFYGNGWGDLDRVKIPLEHAELGSLPANIGATDFTIEWWMKANLDENPSPACSPGEDHWKDGRIIFDRDLFEDGDYGDYGIALTQGTIAFGVKNGTGAATLCGTIPVADREWHHIAVTRQQSDGLLRIFVDGKLDRELLGPPGDISYRAGRNSADPDQEPYLVIAARKSDEGLAFRGWLDEIRISNIIRYTSAFELPQAPFINDENTTALYHFDEGHGNRIEDASLAQGGPSDGIRFYGGDPYNGPEWEVSTLFVPPHAIFLPVIIR
jgi:hypothetical protein